MRKDEFLAALKHGLAGLPQEAWMTEFIAEPEPVTEEDETPGAGDDEMPMGDI